ncbi:MAG: hypothetical protein C0434_17330 [Xanthomonadaceae bacterium]|nr:hypothetical protein [Xanthomonadaceae bacterium]
MSAEVLLILVAEPESAERLADLLADAGLPDGWYETAVELVGGSAPYRNRREQVRGRRPRVRFEMRVNADDARRVIAAVDRQFSGRAAVVMLAQQTPPLVGE